MDSVSRARYIALAARILGAETFHHLVASVPGAREKGRLRFWQEQLLARLTEETGVRITTAQEFLLAFEDAELQPIPKQALTKEEFLQRLHEDPWSLDVDGEIPPDDWLTAAWEIDNFREAHTYDMARTVSKVGDLAYTDDYLASLGRSLSIERQVELFTCIRERSPHREDEFRERFEQFFSQSSSSLPPPLTREQVIDKMGLDEESGACRP
jgi:hypothetical protein